MTVAAVPELRPDAFAPTTPAVAAGKIHCFIASGGGAGPGGGGGVGSSSESQAIASWVESNFTAKPVGGVTVYDLTTS